MIISDIAKKAKKASIEFSSITGEEKNKALESVIESLKKNKDKIFKANDIDIENSLNDKVDMPLIKRLKFDEKKLQGVIDGINSLISLDDPIGKIEENTELANGLLLSKISCAIGVIGVIFESRPDALVQISCLCLKSGNAVMLKGGSEAKETNRALYETIYNASIETNIPKNWMNLLETRQDVQGMLKLDKYIDLIIPRGSNQFVRYIMNNSTIPVMGHADGICHVYVDKAADINMAINVCVDSKTQYVAVCNAAETFLIHEDIAKDLLPKLKAELEKKDTKIFGCKKTCKIIDVTEAKEEDWATEYLDYIVSIKIVSSCEEAIEHINNYGSGHTDSIVTKDEISANKFMTYVDSANVFCNCSTRFSDGFRYGFGAEVGISTNKIHARGPVGLEGLTIYKYLLKGNGDIVDDFEKGIKKFTHKKGIK